jgi:(R,R)-butanediol dehydrogenase/meso-butanediol dehydrogenase/diacetyl reductase
MRQAILEGKRKFAVRDVPEPVLDADEVLIKVRYCGICGSDLHTYIEGVDARYGHEYSGDIVAVGPEANGWSAGDRVTAECIRSCGECYWCTRGEMGLCESFYENWGASAPGFATYTKTKSQQLHKLSPQLSYEEAAVVEPTAVALHAVRQSRMAAGDVIAVLGLGPIGQLVARLAKASGAAAVYAAETSPSRIGLARPAVDEVVDAGAGSPVGRILELTDGRGPDVVFECAGAIATAQQALSLARKGGTILIAGVCLYPVEWLVSSIALRELTVGGAMCFYPGEFAMALRLIEEKKIDVAPLITSVMPLDDINEAFEMAVSGEGGKILIEP